ncbi:hypothetical protein EC973_005209 [Apophysomyces ossiformis]|uniref:Thaumatin-like protein n=1 Tax=Apophysomyces ossiformis TaxID=679940 RepID=A0A8H7BZ42_9FUNG|nr:hypothetical protein EC973_005209 [Apophysomyces ossiformis]
MFFSTLISTLFAAGLVAAAPVDQSPRIEVQNSCGSKLYVGQSPNGQQYGSFVEVPAGGSHTFDFPMGWAGRIWGRTSCQGKSCTFAGIGAPATLAEFYLNGKETFYDISLVDGWNLPVKITPIGSNGNGTVGDSNAYLCGISTCSSLPSCPTGFETSDGGCMSACTKYRTDEYCCTGAYNTPECKTNSFAQDVKAACPNAYSYAYDDTTSAYMCDSVAYSVTFCA